tara:strand:- start:84 stop:380 length:297 start_codon:yes stop_codon:yes gene_type:complete
LKEFAGNVIGHNRVWLFVMNATRQNSNAKSANSLKNMIVSVTLMRALLQNMLWEWEVKNKSKTYDNILRSQASSNPTQNFFGASFQRSLIVFHEINLK